ncbi:DUF4932 domain-containing protein [Salegentibacter sp. Hel_I_6]|uniref:DUF4932 domain-containing protein n=1 Tax=Salegentibacter sp. Hel_I_6 TaxID=1250278 RepID=UPI00055DB0A8|nr:DUF4932 domain-containing protein [Salegentibacter sp. Hel_I_6]
MRNQLTSLLFFLTVVSCGTSKNWESEQGKNSFSASFEDFNSSEKIEIEEDSNKVVYLSYLTEHKEGDFTFKINRDDFKYENSKIVHLKTDLKKPLQMRIKGSSAKGNFKIEYPTYKKKEIKVLYNANFELLSLAYFLSNMYEDLNDNNNSFVYDGKEVSVKDLFALNLKIGNRFENHLDSENLKILNEFFQKHWYLEYTNFVLLLTEFPNTEIPEKSSSQELFTSDQEKERFILALNNFHKEIKFEEYLEEYEAYYSKMIEEVENNLPNEGFITEMEHLYDKEANAYFLNASLTMPFSQGYALSRDRNIGYVFGSLSLPTELEDIDKLSLGYANSKQLRNLSVHEFGHSFVNPVIDNIQDSIISKKDFLFEPIKREMSDQAYSSWKIALYEHFVRAGEIFIARQLGDQDTANKLSKDYIENRHFIYLDPIVASLENWYTNEYFDKTYQEFVKETIERLTIEASIVDNND